MWQRWSRLMTVRPRKSPRQQLPPRQKARPARRRPLSRWSDIHGNITSLFIKVFLQKIYQKKTQLEHILLRPDSYIGSTEGLTTNLWVYEHEGMVHRNVTYVPGLYKIFDEIIVNGVLLLMEGIEKQCSNSDANANVNSRRQQGPRPWNGYH